MCYQSYLAVTAAAEEWFSLPERLRIAYNDPDPGRQGRGRDDAEHGAENVLAPAPPPRGGMIEQAKAEFDLTTLQ